MNSIFNALILFGLLLAAGIVVREFCPPLQKILIPSCIIGGIIGLILGQQVLGLITIPEEFSTFSSYGMRIMMACVPIGVGVTGKKLVQHLDFTFANMTMFGFQLMFGLLLGDLFCKIWPDLPQNWGLLGNAAYFGSHGSIPVIAEICDPQGTQGFMSIGMVLATFGVLWAMIPGMAMANYGARHGWASFTKDVANQPTYFYRGVLPAEKRESLGETMVSPSNVSGIALVIAIIAVNYKFGDVLMHFLARFIPPLGNVGAMIYGLIGGIILWPVYCKIGISKYVDKNTANTISNFVLEMIILGAFATIQLDVVSKFFLPLFLHAAVFCGIVFLFVFWWMKKLNHPEWFEKALMVYGMATGSNPQGFALVRAVDPNNKSCIFEALGVYNAVFFWNFIIQPFAAETVNAGVRVPAYLVSLGLMSTFIIGSIIFSRMKKEA